MRKRPIFLLIAVLFTLLMVYLSYDIARRTTFPGKKRHLPESLKGTRP